MGKPPVTFSRIMIRTRGAVTVFVLAVLVFGAAGQNTNFVFNPSASLDQQTGILLVSGDAAKGPQGKSVTMNNVNAHQQSQVASADCGRVVYKDKVRMVDKNSGAVASFSTSFTFSFASFDNNSTSCGSGMLFMFSANSTVSAAETSLAGGSLCELNWNDPNLRLVAVEFDSHYDPLMSDVSDSHISLDVGVRTVKSHDLCVPANKNQTCAYFCKDPDARYTAWIDYDSPKQTLEVRFGNGSGIAKPVDPVISYAGLRLDEILDEDMYVGFIASTGGAREVHTIWSWEFASTGMSTKPSKSSLALIAGVIGGAVGAVLMAGVLYCCYVRHRKNPPAFYELPLFSFSDESRSYTFRELSDITKNFGASELLSSGGFGDVFKGTLPSGALVAVKRIKEGNAQAGEESFLAEVRTLQQTRHRNLVQLRGWCHSPEGMFLVCDFMCNGSLNKWLHPSGEVSWDVRRHILAGVSSGLKYLHEDGVKCVLHRDIKSSNVLLDEDFNAYLGDFGLARLVDHRLMEKSTLVAGTLGYMAPEMLHTGRATKETDVYAFGILLLEVVCGRKPLQMNGADEIEKLVNIAMQAYEMGRIKELVDPRLADNVGSSGRDEDGGASQTVLPKGIELPVDVLQVGLLCCHPDPGSRPSMQTVDQWFQSREAIALPAVPASVPDSGHYLMSWYSSNLSSNLSSNPSSTPSSNPSSKYTASSLTSSLVTGR